MFWDRRKGDRRSKKDRGAPDTDRRGEADKADRRQWACGILYKTSIAVTEIEDWLTANAEGHWSVGLEGIDEGLASKVLKIMFEDQDDKYAFIEAFSRK